MPRRVLYVILILLYGIIGNNAQSPSYWNEQAKKNLEKMINMKINTNKAKNVILFLGDGLGMSSITAGRILKGQKEGKLGEDASLVFDEFPFTGISKTYNTDKTVADSAGTATAFLCGVKTKYSTIGVDDSVITKNCSSVESARLKCIGDWTLQSGRSAGFVTDMRVTHATPAPFYAASADRWWENDAKLPDGSSCTDIAHQLVHRYPGKNIQVILGGGRSNFLPEDKSDPEYPEVKGKRKDGVDLIKDWERMRKRENASYAYTWNRQMFDQVDAENTDYLFGLFEPNHMKDVTSINKSAEFQDPTLAEMTEKAIKILQKNHRGYFLLVEGGLIDHLHHKNLAVRAISEVVEFDKAINVALGLTSMNDTLIIVTADHAQSMVLSGYPHRGDDIFGKSSTSNRDNMPYTTLLYTTGPGYTRNYTNGRQNITNIDTTSNNYVYQTAVPRSSATHVGEDVVSYSVGPMAHLLSGVYEQNYVAHVMAYAAHIGPYSEINRQNLKSSQTSEYNSGVGTTNISLTHLSFFVILIIYHSGSL